MILRLRSTKLGKVRFVGHRDVGRIWDRALRRCGVPVAFTAGFTPRPRIAFGLALPMGAESLAEYIDVELDPGHGAPDDPMSLAVRLGEAMPDGIDVTAAALLERPTGSLQESVTACRWELWSPGVDAAAVRAACGLLERTALHLERERKGERRIDDVRPVLGDLRPGADTRRLVADLLTAGRALRPAELAALAFPLVDPLDVRVLRTHQWTTHVGERREVLSLPAEVVALDRRVSA